MRLYFLLSIVLSVLVLNLNSALRFSYRDQSYKFAKKFTSKFSNVDIAINTDPYITGDLRMIS
jgi:hypothetical protein